MNFQQLRAFITVAHEGSLTVASEKLFTSQAAVSAQLKGLEEELGVRLFDRTPRGMALTGEGRVLLDEAAKVMEAANNVKQTAKAIQGKGIRGEFRLGTISDPVVLRLGQFFSTLLAKYPDLKLSLSQSISGEIVRRVLQKQIDAGYLIGKVQHPELHCVEIAPVTLRIVAPMSYRDKIASATWTEIAALPWISTPQNCSFRQIAAAMFDRHGATPSVLIEADQEATLVDLVSAGVGLTLIREDVALSAEAAGKLLVWGPGAEVSTLNLVFLRSERGNPLMQAVLDVIAEVWRISVDPVPA
jgi:DNA-binding transcriptional LysR family regulator